MFVVDFKTMHIKAIRRKPHNDWEYGLIPIKHFDPSGEKIAKINEEFLQIETVVPSSQMQRALPKVYKFLKDDLNSYIFNGYSIVGDGTTPQLTAMLTGLYVRPVVRISVSLILGLQKK